MHIETITRSIVAERFRRSAAVITVGTMLFSCLFFYFEEDINYAVSGLAAPSLLKLVYTQPKTGTYRAELTWKAKKGKVYQVLRKTKAKGKYKVVKQLKATSSKGKYTDKKIGKNKNYTYTVRCIKLKGKKVVQTGKYDTAGLTTIAIPSMKVSFTNLKADVSWKKVKGANKYLLHRRVGKSDKFYQIKSVGSGTTAATDKFYLSTHGSTKNKAYNKKLAALITPRLRAYFVDPSNNPISYKVQGYYSKKVGLVKKESYGLCLVDGEFRLEAPTIVSLSDFGTLKWGTVANADGYRLYKSADGSSWTKITDVKHKGSDYVPAVDQTESQVYQTYRLSSYDRNAYYTVRAYATKNGKRIYSAYDTGFTKKYSSHDEKVLFVGDSIGYGSPYYDLEAKNFAYANRISQLTGVSYFNPSIPGATYHYMLHDSGEAEETSQTSTSNIVTGIMQMMVKGENTDGITVNNCGENTSHLTDYDVVVLAGGTNDYLHYNSSITDPRVLLGDPETDWEKITDKTTISQFKNNTGTEYENTYTNESYDYNISTFDGAYNQIMKWIEEASVYRVQHGMKPIQVISMSMFYSDRLKKNFNIPSSRDTTPNSLGLTLQDYQAELDYLNSVWSDSSAMKVWKYDTRSAGILDSNTCPTVTADNLHLTKYSYARYGNSISSFMMQNILAKEEDADIGSESFLRLAAKHDMLKERLLYLEEEASENYDIPDVAPEDVLKLQSLLELDGEYEAEPDPAIEEMKDYIRLLYRYGYLDQMLEECTEEERIRYEKLIEDYDLLNPDGPAEDEEVEPDQQISDGDDEDSAEGIPDEEQPGEQDQEQISGDEDGQEQLQDDESMSASTGQDNEQGYPNESGADQDAGDDN